MKVISHQYNNRQKQQRITAPPEKHILIENKQQLKNRYKNISGVLTGRRKQNQGLVEEQLITSTHNMSKSLLGTTKTSASFLNLLRVNSVRLRRGRHTGAGWR